MTDNNDAVVRAAGLTKIFKDFWGRPKARAVNEIDFDVIEGEIVGLLGPNGSGKSTTIKMLLGLLYPTSGIISVFGRPPTDVRTKNRIGYLPEESYLYKYLTAEETLDFFGALFNISAAERSRRIVQLLDMVGLSHAAKRQVGEFSKGMQRRIGLAQALINDPDLLILDEPTSGLDPLGCREIKDLILFLKKRGKTVIISSHLLADVEDVCDRAMILYGGRIRACGSLNELLTVSNESRLKIPSLSPEEMSRLLSILRENLKGENFEIEHPRRSLEEFFLDVVQEAKSEKMETFGAREGGSIAEYLASGGGKDEKEDILERLAGSPEPESQVQAPEWAGDEAADDAKSDRIISNLLDKSSDEYRSVKKEEEALNAGVSGAAEDLAEVDEKLSKLLGKR